MSGALRPSGDIEEMFGSVAARYDLMNRLMTGSQDVGWRALAAREAVGQPADRVLDAATGTGGLARALRRAGAEEAVGVDVNSSMLDLAALRSRDDCGVAFRYADVMDLPFADGAFTACTIGFGLRNLPDFQLGIREMTRVLAPGGRLVILELSPVRRPLFGRAFDVYFGRVVPILGRLVTGDRDAYRYLPKSMRAFPDARELALMMHAAGLTGIRWRLLAGGSVALHVGTKPGRGENE